VSVYTDVPPSLHRDFGWTLLAIVVILALVAIDAAHAAGA
jgi:hypothetical protein